MRGPHILAQQCDGVTCRRHVGSALGTRSAIHDRLAEVDDRGHVGAQITAQHAPLQQRDQQHHDDTAPGNGEQAQQAIATVSCWLHQVGQLPDGLWHIDRRGTRGQLTRTTALCNDEAIDAALHDGDAAGDARQTLDDRRDEPHIPGRERHTAHTTVGHDGQRECKIGHAALDLVDLPRCRLSGFGDLTQHVEPRVAQRRRAGRIGLTDVGTQQAQLQHAR